jgi:hypothetical protein
MRKVLILVLRCIHLSQLEYSHHQPRCKSTTVRVVHGWHNPHTVCFINATFQEFLNPKPKKNICLALLTKKSDEPQLHQHIIFRLALLTKSDEPQLHQHIIFRLESLGSKKSAEEES